MVRALILSGLITHFGRNLFKNVWNVHHSFMCSGIFICILLLEGFIGLSINYYYQHFYMGALFKNVGSIGVNLENLGN